MAKKLTNMNADELKNLLTTKAASIKGVASRDPNQAPTELVGVQKSIKKGRNVVSDADEVVEEQLAHEEAEAAQELQAAQEALEGQAATDTLAASGGNGDVQLAQANVMMAQANVPAANSADNKTEAIATPPSSGSSSGSLLGLLGLGGLIAAAAGGGGGSTAPVPPAPVDVYKLIEESSGQRTLSDVTVTFDHKDKIQVTGSKQKTVDFSANELNTELKETYFGDISLFYGDDAIEVSGDGNLWLLVSEEPGDSVVLNINLDGGTLTFDMASDDIDVTIDPDSVIQLNGGTLVVSDGKVFVSAAMYEQMGVGELVLNSSLVVDVRGLSEQETLDLVNSINANGTGELRLVVDDASQADLVFQALTANTSITNGTQPPEITVDGDNGTVVTITDIESLEFAKNLYAEIDELNRRINELQTNSDLTALEIEALEEAIKDLQELVGEDSVGVQISEAIGEPTNGSTPATGLWAEIEEAIKNSISDLQEQIKTLTENASTDFDTLKEIGDAITLINTTIGSLDDTYATDVALSDAIDELTTAYTTAISEEVSDLLGTASVSGDTLGELEALITSLTGVVNTLKLDASPNFDTLKEIGDAITLINTTIASLDTTSPEIDTITITASGEDAAGAYGEGDVVTVVVDFDESVLVNGETPVFNLNIGTNIRQATYVDGAGSDKLTFEYTISGEDYDGEDGISVNANALTGDIADAAGNSADLSHNSIDDDAGLIVDNGPLEVTITAGEIFGSQFSSADVVIGFFINENDSLDSASEDPVFMSSLDAEGYLDIPDGFEFIDADEYFRYQTPSQNYDPLRVPGNQSILIDFTGKLALWVGDKIIVVSEDQLREFLTTIYPVSPEIIEYFISQATVSAEDIWQFDGALAGEELASEFLAQIAGRDPQDIIMTVTSPLTVAQAAALVEAGFDLTYNVTYNIRDFDTTVQAAMLVPATATLVRGADQVLAIGDELDNAMRFTSFDQRVNLRIEGKEGDDTIDVGRGDDEIVGGRGADEINLTFRDNSVDNVIYQNVLDGRNLPMTSLTFSGNDDLYKEGSQLTATINGHEVSYTMDSDDTEADALNGLAEVAMHRLADVDPSTVVVGVAFDVTGLLALVVNANGQETLADYASYVYLDEFTNGSRITPAGGELFVPFESIFGLNALTFNAALFENGFDFDTTINGDSAIIIAGALYLLGAPLGVEGGQTFSLTNELLFSVPTGDDNSFQFLASEKGMRFSLSNAADDFINDYKVDPTSQILSGVKVNGNTVTFYGAETNTELTVEGGGDGLAAIENPGRKTVFTVDFSSLDADWPTETNDGFTTEFEREISITIDGVEISADIVFDNSGDTDIVATLDNLLDAILAENQVGGDIAGLLSADDSYIDSEDFTLVLTGATAPSTDDSADAPTFEVESVDIETNGEQQQTKVTFSSNDDDYYEGGKLRVEIAGESVEADMVGGDAADSVQNLRDAVEIAARGLKTGVFNFSSSGFDLTPDALVNNALSNVQRYVIDIKIGDISVFKSVNFQGDIAGNSATNVAGVTVASDTTKATTVAEVVNELNRAFDGVAVFVLDAAGDKITFSTGSANNVTSSTGGGLAQLTLQNQAGTSGGYIDASPVTTVSQPNSAIAAVLESVSQDDTSLTVTASTEEPDPLKVNAELDYQGELQEATFELEDASQYCEDTDGDTVDRGADVHFLGGKAFISIRGAGDDGVLGNGDDVTVVVSADMSDDAAGTSQNLLNAILGELGEDLADIISDASMDADGTITLTAEQYGKETFEISDVRLDYQGIKQLASITLESESSYDSTFLNGGSEDDSKYGRGDDVYFVGGKVYATITGAGADGIFGNSDDVSFIVSADMSTDAAGTSENLVDAINAETQLGEDLYGVIDSASFDSGTITLTASEYGEHTFEVTDVALDYQGQNQIAEAYFSISDDDYYEGGTLSITIDTTPDVADGVSGDVVFTVDMISGDANGSLQDLVDLINVGGVASGDASPAIITLEGSFGLSDKNIKGMRDTNDNELTSGFYLNIWKLYWKIGDAASYSSSSGSGSLKGNSTSGSQYWFDSTASDWSNLGHFLSFLTGSFSSVIASAEINADGDIVITGSDDVTFMRFAWDVKNYKATEISGEDNGQFFPFFNDSGDFATHDISDNSEAAEPGYLGVTASLDADGTITLISSLDTEHVFDITDAELSYEGVQQEAIFSFSSNSDDYFNDGSTIDSDNDGVGYIGVTINGVTFTQKMFDGSDDATISALFNQIDASVISGDLSDEIADVSLSGDSIIVTALEPEDGSGEVTVSDVFMDVDAIEQVTVVDFGDIFDSDFVSADDSMDDGQIQITINGIVVSADFGGDINSTLDNLKAAIEAYETTNSLDLVGDITVSADTLVITALNAGSDDLTVSDVKYSVPDSDLSSTQKLLFKPANTILDDAVAGTTITLRLNGQDVTVTVGSDDVVGTVGSDTSDDLDPVGDVDRGDQILQFLIEQAIAFHASDDDTTVGLIERGNVDSDEQFISVDAGDRGTVIRVEAVRFGDQIMGVLEELFVKVTRPTLPNLIYGVDQIDKGELYWVDELSSADVDIYSGQSGEASSDAVAGVDEIRINYGDTGDTDLGLSLDLDYVSGDDDAPLEQDFQNPDSGRGTDYTSGDSDFFGDSPLTGVSGEDLLGIDQDFMNPDNGRESGDSNSGDSDFWGDDPMSGSVSADGSEDVLTGDGVQQSHTNPGSGYDSVNDSPSASGDDNPGNDDLYGSDPGYYSEDGLYTEYLNGGVSSGTSDDDGNYLYNNTSGDVVIDDTVNVGASTDTFDDDDSSSDVFLISLDDAGLAPFESDYARVSEVSSGNDEADIINNFQTAYDFIELEGSLLRSTVEGESQGEDSIEGVVGGNGAGFDLNLYEFGLVDHATSTLTADQLDNAQLVSELLNVAFVFNNGEDNIINTSVFAITAEDNDNVTAIWVHQQSRGGDNSVEHYELSLLATVYTRGDEFQLENFLPEPNWLNPQQPG